MTINVKQFLQTFLDESNEMLQEMEKDLLEIQEEKINSKNINGIFRVAHSIKSSSNIFNFKIMSSLSHTLENYLDDIRNNIRKLSKDEIEYLFEYIDCMRDMLSNIENNLPIDTKKADDLNTYFSQFINTSLNATVEKQEPEKNNKKEHIFKIDYCPNKQCFLNGQEPFRILNALSELGDIQVEIDIKNLPSFKLIDPTLCYLKWNIQLKGDINKKEIEEVLAWALDENDIKNIETISETDFQEPLKKEPPKGTPTIKGTPIKGTPIKGTPIKGTPIKGTPIKGTPLKNQPEPMIDNKTDQSPQQKNTKEITHLKMINEPPGSSHAKSIRVATEKIDNLMDIAGEFVILQSIFNQIQDEFQLNKNVVETIDKLEQNSLKLQDALLRMRMIPIEFAFTRFPRMVHDLSEQLGKKIELTMSGEKTELDRSIIEKIIDPLSHLIRNAIDHGIEMPETRKNMQKNPVGHIKINTYQENNNVIIEITDDGAGLNLENIRKKAIKQGLLTESDKISKEDILNILSQPGFSTATTVTEISGRGVGMDVVIKNVSEVGGKLSVETKEEKGTTFQIRLPLTLAIMECQLIKVNNIIYAVPLISFIEIIQIELDKLIILEGMECYKLRDNYIKIIRLNQFLSKIEDKNESLENKYLLIIDDKYKKIAFSCDEILWQQQVVIKNIEDNFCKIPGITGATILGNGKSALVIDVQAISTFKTSEIKSIKNEWNLFNKTDPSALEKLKDIKNLSYDILSFLISNREYGVDIRTVKEIIISSNITPLPNVPSYVKGIINLRGLIVPVIDILECFSLGKIFNDTNEYPIITFNLSLGTENKTIGIIVDSVNDTYHVLSDNINKIPEDDELNLKDHIEGLITVENKNIPILNINHLVFK